MTAKDFKAAAGKDQPYAFDIDREVTEFYRDHPEQKRKIFFIDVSALPPRLIRGNESDGDDFLSVLGTNSDISEKMKLVYKSGTHTVPYPELNYSCIILNTPLDRKMVNFMGHGAPDAIVDALIFDHESGHTLCAAGHSEGEPDLSESVADAYAVMRHFQRFGMESEALEKLAAMRTTLMVFLKAADTSPVVEQLLADSKNTDFSILTPEETMQAAQQYALAAARHPLFIRSLNKAFENFYGRGLLPEMVQGDFSGLKELGDFVLATTVPAEFKAGSAAIRTVLDGHVLGKGVRILPPADEAWVKKLRMALDRRQAVYESTGTLFGAEKNPAANNNTPPPKPQ